MDGYIKSNIVIGLGEIGQAIQQILDCDGIDIVKGQIGEIKESYDAIHICIPYNKDFIKSIKNYQKKFNPKLTIIHSTVPVGTNLKLKSVASPCQGVHPNLVDGIKTFTKYFGGEMAEEASKIFEEKGLKTFVYADSRTIEASKLWCTTQYGWNIILEKEIYKYCQENGVNFDIVYKEWNRNYNEGYNKLNCPQFQKYNLKHYNGKIGGHCILPNIPLLKNKLGNFIKKYNDTL